MTPLGRSVGLRRNPLTIIDPVRDHYFDFHAWIFTAPAPLGEPLPLSYHMQSVEIGRCPRTSSITGVLAPHLPTPSSPLQRVCI